MAAFYEVELSETSRDVLLGVVGDAGDLPFGLRKEETNRIECRTTFRPEASSGQKIEE